MNTTTETVDTDTGELHAAVINYEIHPIAALFPFIEGDAFREFVEDIRTNGQREPVVLDLDGRLLDGRNRARACQALGIDVREVRYDGQDVESWIISHNVHRRHLTTSQRSMIAARLATLKRGTNQYEAKVGGSEEPSIESAKSERSAPSIVDAAAQLNVARESVKRARSIIESGDPDLIKSVESGSTTVTAAAREVTDRAKAAGAGRVDRTMPRDQRADIIRDLAGKGWTSAQMVDRTGVSEPTVRQIARDYGIPIPGDRAMHKQRRVNSNDIVDNLVIGLEGSAMSLDLVDPTDLDREQAQYWATSLTESLQKLNRFAKQIKEIAQ